MNIDKQVSVQDDSTMTCSIDYKKCLEWRFRNTVCLRLAFLTLMVISAWARASDEQQALQSSVSSFYEAVVAADPARIKPWIYFADDDNDAVVAAQADRLAENIKLMSALSEKMNIPHGERPLNRFHVFRADDIAFTLGAGEWEIKGDVATLPPTERMGGEAQPPPPPMRKIKGVWRLDLSGAGKVNAKALAAQIRRYTDVLRAATNDVGTGKLTKLPDVEAALARAPKFLEVQQMPPLVLAPMQEKK